MHQFGIYESNNPASEIDMHATETGHQRYDM